MKYRVISTENGGDLTDDFNWVLKPNGDLYFIDDWGNLCSIGRAEVVPECGKIDQSIFDASNIKFRKVTNPY